MAVHQTAAGQISAVDGSTAEGITAEGSMAAGVRAEGIAEETPIACSLTSADLAAQADRWERLAARAMTGRTETAHGLRIGFRPGHGAEQELRALVAVETECCPWATWTVQTGAGRITLDIRSAGEGIAALRSGLVQRWDRSAQERLNPQR